MTTTRIKEKISALVSSQLPEFIQSDFPTFIAFIEAYYRFLEQDQGASELIQNARSYNDIDRTTNDFVEFFLNTYAKNIPLGLLSDKRFLVKKIKDLYESKGSELSFKLLFRILFDTDVEIAIPFENVLRASGGNWQQSFSIRVETISGNRNDLTERILTHTAGGVIFETPIVRTKILTSNLTEIFLNNLFLSSNYVLGDLVEVFQGSTLVFSGIIKPTTVSSNVQQAGIGFKIGQIFTINSEGGVNTLVKVTNINNVGGITGLKIINFGFNYNDPTGFIFVTLDPTKSVSETVNVFSSKTQGFGSSGSILTSDPTSSDRYFLEDYLSDQFYTFTGILAEFDDSVFNPQTTVQETIPDNFAFVRFNLGALAKYPGSYFTDKSFLSEFEVRLQDNQLYQPFAYQTITNVDISDFLDIVKKLLNPAGQVLFNNRTLLASIDLSAELVLSPVSNIFFEAYDSIDIKDLSSFNFLKNTFDISNVIENVALQLNKFEDDNTITEEVYSSQINKNIGLETIIIYDPTSPERYFEEEYVLSNTYTFTSFIEINNEIVTMTDDVNINFLNTKVFLDTANVIDLPSLTTNKSINNNESIINVIESTEIQLGSQDYVEQDYFSEIYVATFNIVN